MPSTGQAATGRVEIDALLGGSRWTGTVNYGFPDSPSDFAAGYGDEPANGFFAISTYQQQVVQYAFGLVSAYTNLKFNYVGKVDADIAFGQTSLAETAYATFPGSSRGGDVWFGDDFRNPRVGDYAFLTHLHEIGHALGLKHPHEASDAISTTLPIYQDWLGETVMSYRSQPGGPIGYNLPQFHFPTTFMALDIQALQTMYGANYNTNAGNTVYSWSQTTAQQFINGVGQLIPGSGSGFSGDGAANHIFMTVWDGGGIDTYDFSGYGTQTQTLHINLEPGQASNVGNGSISNAFMFNADPRSLIENAIGSVNSDYITGNQANNRLEGRDGHDMLYGRSGNDGLVGGAGDDEMVGGAGSDVMQDSVGYNIMRGGAGSDTARFECNMLDALVRFLPDGRVYVGTSDGFTIISGTETLQFADGTLSLRDLKDTDNSAPVLGSHYDNHAIAGPDQWMNPSFGMQFGEDVTAGTGKLRIYYTDGTLYRSYSASELLDDYDNFVFRYPAAEGQYYVEVDAGFVIDHAGNPSVAITGKSAWNFYVGIRADDFASEIGTGSGSLTVNGPAIGGYLSDSNDSDTFRVVLQSGETYSFNFDAPGVNGAEDAIIEILDSSGYTLFSGKAGDPLFVTGTGGYTYVRVRSDYYAPKTPAGDFSIAVKSVTDDYAGDASTSASVTPGSSIQGVVQGQQDLDWVRIDLVAGQTYRFTLTGVDTAQAGDANSLSMMLTRQEDGSTYYNPLPGNPGGPGGYSLLASANYEKSSPYFLSSNSSSGQFVFTADRSGTYYVQLQSLSSGQTSSGGGYKLAVAQGTFTTPHLISYTPAASATVDPSANIVLTFDQAVKAGEGYITLSDGQKLIKIDINDSSQVQISGSTITINPTDDLTTRYQVRFDRGAILGTDGTVAEQSIEVTFAPGFYQAPSYGQPNGISDDFSSDVQTLGAVSIGRSAYGKIDTASWSNTKSGGPGFDYVPDADWFKIELVAGQTYDIQLLIGTGSQKPNQYSRDVNLEIRDANGNLIASDLTNSGGGINSHLLFTATQSGTYYIVAVAGQDAAYGYDNTPRYEILVTDPLGATRVGTANADTLTGTGGFDRLDGKGGADSMSGGLGGDTYVVDNAADVVNEAIGAGTDTVESAITYTLGENVERLVLTGTAAINGSGNALANTLVGNAAANTLDGGAGADVMEGGAGDDIYVVDTNADVVKETSASGGVDLVRSVVNYGLGAYLENLTLVGAAALNGNGNELANVLTGNDAANVLSALSGNDRLFGNGGNDTLNGGVGADVMYGGAGNDTYIRDNAGDLMVEALGQGLDTVLASVTTTLGANVEDLTLTGGGATNGTGNALANVLTGNTAANQLFGMGGADRLLAGGGNDRLDGGTGADVMYGGAGDDVYIRDDSGDAIVEKVGEGIDTVLASVSTGLGANVEKLTLTGTIAINGTGNELANELTGNSAANTLTGKDGDDRLTGNGGNDFLNAGSGADIVYAGDGTDSIYGGAGRDYVVGGAGADTFFFRNGDFAGLTAGSCDVVQDFSSAQGDRINLTGVDANRTLSGDQAFHFIGTAAFDGTAGALRYVQENGNTFIYGDTNGDKVADFLIRLDGLHTLTSGDFGL